MSYILNSLTISAPYSLTKIVFLFGSLDFYFLFCILITFVLVLTGCPIPQTGRTPSSLFQCQPPNEQGEEWVNDDYKKRTKF